MNKNQIKIRLLSDDSFIFMKKKIKMICEKIKTEETNKWIYEIFPENLFTERSYEIEDFQLEKNPEEKNKTISFNNSIKLYEHLNKLPKYILSDIRFWLWLTLDKFYSVAKEMIPINDETTILNMWMGERGKRRGLMFNVLARCYYRVALSVNNSSSNPYELSKWVIENPLRYRNLTWRSFSSNEHLVRGILKGEKRAVEANNNIENNDIYPEIAKYVSKIGSVRLLDAFSEEDISNMVYDEALKLLKEYN
ncbi:DUF6339 family protein [Mycoplasmopsis adleri]|uniref:DUF6339 family protein n=1 Tax=Mycoplasmopsis adleri TaxID=51362 RepID=UPI003872AF04